jgi:hypothetical protein
MTRPLSFTLKNDIVRQRAIETLRIAPVESRFDIRGPVRSDAQNDRFWAMLTDISRQVVWYGAKYTKDDWRLIFLDGLKREMRNVPNIDGSGYVNIGRSSSKLSKQEFSDLFEIMEAFAAREGVVFRSNRGAA